MVYANVNGSKVKREISKRSEFFFNNLSVCRILVLKKSEGLLFAL